MNNGNIAFAVQDGFYFIRLSGSVRQTSSYGLDKLISKIKTDPHAKGILVDLTQAYYLDSTTLGLLAKITNLSLSNLHQKATLISPNDDINTILNSMGFNQVFHIAKSWTESSLTYKDITDKSETLNPKLALEAHRTLGQMNQKNSNTFRNVIELMEIETSEQSD